MREQLQITKKVFWEEKDFCEFYYEIYNPSKERVYLDKFTMFEADSLEKMGIDASECVLFRTGRHKNDIPSVMTLGKPDGAMQDALGSMSETGDRAEGNAQHRILSDHLTVLGNKGNYVVIAFMTGCNQMLETEVILDEEWAFQKLTARVLFGVYIPAGATVTTETIRIQHTKDAEAAIWGFAREKAPMGRVRKKTPSVFCTWYYYGLTVTYEDVRTNLSIMKEKKLPFDVFQVDEGWEQTLGEWEPNQKFPKPMKEVADEIREAGYMPGIWTSPFVAHETASVWKEHPEWMLRKADGSPCIFPMNDTVYRVFDITNPATWEYFRELYHKLTFDWGYVYHKLDFTRASVIYEDAVHYDDTITLAQAYRCAVEAIRSGMGEDSYFLMCGGLYDPIIGLVDAQRTGSDVLSMWSSNINKDGKTLPYTVKQSLLRYYMNEWWDNDPDALMVRINENMERGLRLTYGLLNDEEVKTAVVNQFMSGGLVCSTEPLDKICDERLYELRHILPMVDTSVQPLGIMKGERFPSAVCIYVEKTGAQCVAFINWSDDKEMPVKFCVEDYVSDGEDDGTVEEYEGYIVCDFYSGKYFADVKKGQQVEFASLKPHAATVVKIEKRLPEIPVVVASNGHYSMGAELKKLEIIGDMLMIEGENAFAYELSYTVLLPEGYEFANGAQELEVKLEEQGHFLKEIGIVRKK